MRRVAITGFGVVSPIGVGRPAFFRSLLEGSSGIAPITHFNTTAFEAKLAAEVKDPLDVPPDVAAYAGYDPKIAFGYAACVEALAEAGVARLGPRDLLHLGSLRYTLDVEDMTRQPPLVLAEVVRRAMGGERAPLQLPLDTLARLIARDFGVPGQSLTNCSACAAGAQAIGHGFRGLRSGRWDRAVCGGFHTMIDPLGVATFQLLGAVTLENALGPRACRPFDAGRAGTVLGEGAGIVVLEPLEQAVAAGKRVLAEVCGYGSSLDAHGLSAPDPEGRGVELSMRDAVADAGLTRSHVGHINTHGTGTFLNDEVEAEAIRRVFAETWERVPISSTKSLTGHMMAAAGAVEVGACLLALLEGRVPHNPSLSKVGRDCELCHVTGEPARFDGEYVLTNSLGFGGQNASLVLKRA